MEIKTEGGYQTLHNIVTLFRSLLDKDMDVIVPITGPKGFGKSSLALQIIRVYLERYYPEISLEKNLERFVVFTDQEVIENLLREPEKMPLNIDEAYRCMASEDWAKAESKYLKKVFAQIRIKHRLILACLPEFWWLDKKYREDMVIFWLHVIARGKAILFTADLSIGCEDKWHRKEFMKLTKKRRTDIFTPPEEIVNIYTKHPCFVDVVSFPPLQQSLHEKYLKLREQALLTSATTQEFKFHSTYARFLLWLKIYKMYKEEGITVTRKIAEALTVPEDTVRDALGYMKYHKIIV